MGCKAKGTVRPQRNAAGELVWFGMWTLSDKSRSPWTELDEKFSLDDKAQAEAYAARLAPTMKVAPVGAAGAGAFNRYTGSGQAWKLLLHLKWT
jgi:hypothetical protein